MLIVESALIKAGMDGVWTTFTDLSRWREWNSTACDASSPSGVLREGERIRFCIRPFAVPVDLAPVIDEVKTHERVVWSGCKFGIASRHEFLFQRAANGIVVTSREEFRGIPLLIGGRRFTERVARDLVRSMLRELKAACESAAGPPED